MLHARTAALQAFRCPAWNMRARIFPQLAHKQQYSSATSPPRASSSIPWIILATIATGGGTWYALQPRSPAHQDEHHAEGTPKPQGLQDKVKEKKDQIKASLIKPERDGNSVENHAKAAEINEHKVRQGKFCEDEFDNHITSHSNDPSKDFEKIKRREAAHASK